MDWIWRYNQLTWIFHWDCHGHESPGTTRPRSSTTRLPNDSYHLVMTNSLPWKITMLLIGKPSISMGYFPWLAKNTTGEVGLVPPWVTPKKKRHFAFWPIGATPSTIYGLTYSKVNLHACFILTLW
jgi:hypothetical protein